MAYKQGGNPLSRKSSPLNAKNPFNRVSPINNTISGDKLDLESDNPSIHKPSEHNPKLEGQPMPDKDYEADQPNYESDDYKPGMSRNSSSPVNAKCPEGWKINPDPNAKKPCIKIRGAENPAGPKKGEEALSRKSSSPLNKHDEWQKKIDEAKAKDGDNPDFYEVYAHLYKGQEKARLAHKEEKPKEEKTQ